MLWSRLRQGVSKTARLDHRLPSTPLDKSGLIRAMQDAHQSVADSIAHISDERLLEPVTDEELFAPDRFSWLEGEALAEMILWDSSRRYDAHREALDRLRAAQ